MRNFSSSCATAFSIAFVFAGISGYAVAYISTTGFTIEAHPEPLTPSMSAYRTDLRISLRTKYPWSVLEGSTPSAMRKTAAFMWSAIIRNALVVCSSSPYFLSECCSKYAIMGAWLTATISGVLVTAMRIRSSPPPKSTFCLGSVLNVPSSFLIYCINTLFPISKNLPQSQFG